MTPPTFFWVTTYSLLYNAKGLALQYPWLIAAPGAAITLLALSLALIGEGLGEAARTGGR